MTRSFPPAQGRALEGAGFNSMDPARTLNRRALSPSAGDESRQAPAFCLHEQVGHIRLLSGYEFFALAISLVARADGGCVRKGERGHKIFYADRFTPEDGREGGDAPEGEPRSIPFLKRFVVFNAAQCDGLPERLTADPTPLPPREQHESAEGLIAATGADFRIGGARLL